MIEITFNERTIKVNERKANIGNEIMSFVIPLL